MSAHCPRSLSAEDLEAETRQLRNVWNNPDGRGYWTSVSNFQIGLWYGSSAFAFMLLRACWHRLCAQLAVPQNDLVSADFYNRAFTLHGTVMMFPLAVPAFEAVAIFLLPPMLGSRAAVSEARVHSASEASSSAEFLSAVRSFSTLPLSGWFIYPLLAPTSETGELWVVVNERDEIGIDLLPDREGSRLLWLALLLLQPACRHATSAATTPRPCRKRHRFGLRLGPHTSFAGIDLQHRPAFRRAISRHGFRRAAWILGRKPRSG